MADRGVQVHSLLSCSLGFDVLDERLPSGAQASCCTPDHPSRKEQTAYLEQTQLQDASNPREHVCMQVTSHTTHACVPLLTACLSQGLRSPTMVTLWGSFCLSSNGAVLTLRSLGCDHSQQPGNSEPILMDHPDEGLLCSLFKQNTDGQIESKAVFSEWGRGHEY